METLDARGLACPEPVLLTKSHLELLRNGVLKVLINSGAARDNISFMAKSLGWQVQVDTRDEDILLTLKK